MNHAISLIKPNVASIGYALFLAVNACGAWGGVFPFLPAFIQTTDLLFWFYLILALALLGAFLYATRIPDRVSRVRPFVQIVGAAAVYFCGWAFLIAAMYLEGYSFSLVILGGAALGFSSGQFYLLWQRVFAGSDQSRGVHHILLAFIFAALIYFALYIFPQAVTAYLIPLVFLPLFALALIIASRSIDWTLPMFSDSPREHIHVYRHAVGAFWRSALCMGAFALCAGVSRATAISDPGTGVIVNILSMIALFVGALVVLVLWNTQGLVLNILKLFRVFFPVLLTLFVLLPFAPSAYIHLLAAVLYALFSLGLMLTIIQCARISQDNGISPFFAFGTFGGIVYGLHDLGFILGNLISVAPPALPAPILLSIAVLYLLALIFFVSVINFKDSAQKLFATNDIELLSSPLQSPALIADTLSEDEEVLSTPSFSEIHETESVQVQYQLPDYTEALRQAKTIYQLSNREVEVIELVLDGFTVARIAETLFVSENTVRTHKKRIYAKLGVHKKSELKALIRNCDQQ